MYIDAGLLFENSGSGKGTTFRLMDYKHNIRKDTGEKT